MQIVILGAAESGVGAALLAQAKGHAVFVSDGGSIKPAYKEKLTQAGIRFEENQHTLDEILRADEVVKSPGIPEKAPIIQALRAKGTPIISEIELAGRYTQAKCICITGTNGKTTTTLLTYHLLKEAGLSVGLAGNVGHSLAEQVIDDKHDYYVVELSSFQLDDTHDFAPWLAILLNITPDHLDRYGYSLENYAAAKMRVAHNVSRYFIYNAGDPETRKAVAASGAEKNALAFDQQFDGHTGKKLAAWYGQDGTLRLHLPEWAESRFDSVKVANSPLIGQHNQQNMAAAILVARVVGLSPEQIEKGLVSFKNAPHRLQLVGEVNGVKFINDSKATNVEAAWFALDGVQQSIVWIAGGTDKGNDYTSLLPLAKQKAKALICLGVDNEKLKASFSTVVPHLEETQSIETAVRRAAELAAPGDVVLLSPACASFDLFKNYEDRGQQFTAAVEKLTLEKSVPSA
ncbi:UDP-N-acetylmuramoyl-L-alanine--D-glutamate ligase [Hymenobacter sp. BT188]|uniref:UDP-N-acetylmuramoyl-L-alanine--D-glutamate ligase n=1 Tax=Hymenobacter sp. BT188 TaxID=2763504 RepID=UPI001651910A|nr:UDP-N-acetylmuramoyl-L-alanine--D-glutamate ligase [Hymenobacter sp. BT188]MBC6607378.1 UDP-N-acetylmuramoyl-L-alanine--D-glutamate ligase [Hymenobacter sp. BT188]